MSETAPAPEFAFIRGRAALYAALKALGVGSGDEVILTGFTCVVVANAVQFLGAACRYADIDPRTFGTDPGGLEAARSPQTRALVVQHSFGIPADLDPILSWATAHGIAVIEDSALALGSKYRGRDVGSFGVAAFWSGQQSKPLPVGLGGFLRVNDPELVEPVRQQWLEAPPAGALKQTMVAVQFGTRRIARRILGPGTAARLRALDRVLARRGLVGGSSPDRECAGEMPSDFFARCGALQFRAWRRGRAAWQRDVQHRARIVSIYEGSLAAMGFRTVDLEPWEEVVYSRYPVRVANKRETIDASRREAVEIGDWMDQPLHEAAASLDRWGYRPGMCPEGEKAARETINLPTHRRISVKEARRVLAFLERHARPA